MESSLKQHPKFDDLYKSNEDFRKLSDEHVNLKREAAYLNKAKFLSPDSEMKMHAIKKRKLEIKDKLEAMLS